MNKMWLVFTTILIILSYAVSQTSEWKATNDIRFPTTSHTQSETLGQNPTNSTPGHFQPTGDYDTSTNTTTPSANPAARTEDTFIRYEVDNLFPLISWEEKMELYYNGRPAAAVRYPLGLDIIGVEQLSDNVYSIDKTALYGQKNTQDLLTHARIDDAADGRPTFSEIVPGGIFDKLGIRTGDQITAMNGASTVNYSELYAAYQANQNHDLVTLHIRRNNHDIEFTYFIK